MKIEDSSEYDSFSSVSKQYDFLNPILSFGIDIYWRKLLLHMMLQRVHTGDIILDIATGTFDIARAIVRKKDVTVFAIDYSLSMLTQGSQKIQDYPSIIPIQADGRKLPLKDQSVHLATISFGIRNIKPRSLVFQEWYRLLKARSPIYILEFCNLDEVHPTLRPLYQYYLSRAIPCIASIFGADVNMYKYLAESIQSFPSCHHLCQELHQAGFTNISYTKHSLGIVAIYTATKP